MITTNTINKYPKVFPESWASDWGEDEYGIWMGFTYKGVRQGFRWIQPGTFLMGSPVNEPERYDSELQHEVTLTRGYWLADTACTQGLWEAVMGKNPSGFRGDTDNPVENVSWGDAQDFIGKLNKLKVALNLCLPTEAEWEYACRAGTTNPFHFGKNIITDQVNYNGNYPYSNGQKGEYREKTVPVKALSCNKWGLYQMHGNVWEWCSDWYGAYTDGGINDPKGPDEGVNRVLRGGSWNHLGRYCRSAYRNFDLPGYRLDFFGFRLSGGQE